MSDTTSTVVVIDAQSVDEINGESEKTGAMIEDATEDVKSGSIDAMVDGLRSIAAIGKMEADKKASCDFLDEVFNDPAEKSFVITYTEPLMTIAARQGVKTIDEKSFEVLIQKMKNLKLQ